MSSEKIKLLPVKELHFDPNNPRFFNGQGQVFDSEQDVIDFMLRAEAISDLVYSIGQQGFFAAEPLIVIEKEGKYIVAEGNRRLAALKVLNAANAAGSETAAFSLPANIVAIAESLEHHPQEVPCLVYQSEAEVLHFLGYRHVTGIRTWGALQKAFYLERLMHSWQKKDESLKQPENYPELFRKLAKDIGSSTPAIRRSLTALAFYKKGAEQNSYFFGVQGIEPADVNFGSLYTALSYPNIAKYVGIEAGDLSLRNLDTEHAKRLSVWMFERKAGDVKPVISDTRELKNLNYVLGHEEAKAQLEQENDLTSALLLTLSRDMGIERLLKQIGQINEQIYRLSNDVSFTPTEDLISQAKQRSESLEDFSIRWKRKLKECLGKEGE